MVSIEQKRRRDIRLNILGAAAITLCASFCSKANAFEFDTGNDDLQVRLDNTVRYNFGQRVQGQNSAILANPNFDDGDRNFANGSTVTDRVDLLSDFDVVYQQKYGFRVSAASWYDAAYSGSFSNNSVKTSNHLVNGVQTLGLGDYAQRYYEGPSAEVLDAFVFGTFNLGSMPLTLRFGKHNVNWGESVFLEGSVHGDTYGQAPLDIGKAFSTPGIEAKELYLPLTQLSSQLQATPELTLAGQYYLRWAPSRVMEDGTYLAPADNYFLGGQSAILGYLPAKFGGGPILSIRGQDITPKNSGDFGLAARWSPAWLDGTMGFYYRNFTDKLPQSVLIATRTPLGVLPTEYLFTYGSNIDLFGYSLSKQIAGISFGMDLNYRTNMPLVSGPLIITPAQIPGPGDLVGPRGDTVHGVLNAIGSISSTPLFNSATWAAEFTWNRWLSVTSDPLHAFTGYSTYTGIDKVTKDAFTLSLNFTPTWYQVFPGADLSMPLNFSTGLGGNSAVLLGGNKGGGDYSVGLGLDLYSKYRFDLKFVDFFGATNTVNGEVPTANGFNGLTALLKDRGAVYLTFKTTF